VAWGRWTIRTAAKVRVDPHSVVAWFQHPDRAEEVRATLQEAGITGVSSETSISGNTRILDVRYQTPSGSSVHRRSVTELDPDGRAGTWSGDRFVVVAHGFVHVRPVVGEQETEDWNDTFEFVPADDGTTEIVHTHHQQFMDPRWHQWLFPSRMERARRKEALGMLALRCEEDEGKF
jgi:hypothetical protein